MFQNREIARENANLLDRLQRTNVRVRKQSSALGPPESSASINRRKQQERIQRENLVRMSKFADANRPIILINAALTADTAAQDHGCSRQRQRPRTQRHPPLLLLTEKEIAIVRQ